MGSNRKNKKRNRSSASSDGSNVNTPKRKKSVGELLNGIMDESLTVPDKTTELQIPESLDTDQLNLSSPVPISQIKLPDDTPEWARVLVNSVESLRMELIRVNAISENTQKALEGLKQGNQDLSAEVNSLSSKVSSLEQSRAKLLNENTELKERLLLLEFHQCRNNLIFSGIPEADRTESGYDCYNKIMQCLSQVPGININEIRIDRCHRLGAKLRSGPRGIIARMNWYGDLMTILGNKKQLPDGIYVQEDLPEEWVDDAFYGHY